MDELKQTYWSPLNDNECKIVPIFEKVELLDKVVSIVVIEHYMDNRHI